MFAGKQEGDFAAWWREEELRGTYCTGGGCSGAWDEIQPTALISTLLLQELLLVAIGDGIKAIIPVVRLPYLSLYIYTEGEIDIWIDR